MLTTLLVEKFTKHEPAPQQVIDIFKGRWACDLTPIAPGTVSGAARLFVGDDRPGIAARAAGGLAGKSVLEIGPLEGAHTWQLEKLGATRIVAVEANVESFLKCLIVKELAQLNRSTFLLGDGTKYIRSVRERFDLIFCSGVLYHLSDPFQMIRAIANATDRVFIWTHFLRDDVALDATTYGPKNFRREVVEREGIKLTYYVGTYRNQREGQFWGGNEALCVWMTLDGILSALKHCGFTSIDVERVEAEHVGGPCVTLNASKF